MTLSCEHDMNRREFIIASAVAGLTRRFAASPIGSRIDRVALVKRHCPVLSEANINSSLQVGNGEFAFAADITGLQTFAEEYLKGMPLGTLSDWGWHSFPNPAHYRLNEIMGPYDSHGREVPYAESGTMAMTAARLGERKKAMDVLMMSVPKNHYLPDGQCFQRLNLPLYLPANGGLLYATAMMAAGWNGAPNGPAPGFPKDGRWNVRYEGLQPAL